MRNLLALVLLLSTTSAAWAQVAVNGTVTDERGSRLPGVNVVVAGTSLGTATDLEGRFSFTIDSGTFPASLEFRFVGYRTERRAVTAQPARQEVNVRMTPDLLGIDEVVVTGTGGGAERRQLGNAISTVDAAPIAESGAVDLTAALSGKITGAMISQTSGSPAGSISVRLRGNSTINASAEPLYIIDGVIVDNSSFELVTVGSGGVQNRLVDLNPNDIERIEVIKGAAAAAIYGSRASNGVVQIFTKRGQVGKPRITYTASMTSSDLRKRVRLNEAPYDWANPFNNADTTRVRVQRYDYQDYIFRPASGTDHYVSIAGGAGTTTYFVSGSYFYNQGIVRNADFNRGTFRLNVGQELASWAYLRSGINLTRSFANDIPTGGPGFFDGSITTLQFVPNIVDARPTPLGEYPAIGAAAFGNPYEVVDRYKFSQEVNRIQANVNLTLTPMEGLTANVVGGYDTFTQTARGFKPVGTVAQPTGFATYADLNRTLYNVDFTATYGRTFGVIASTTTAGATYQYEQTQSLTNAAINLGPVVETVAGGSISSYANPLSELAVAGAFAQQTVGYNDRLFFTVAGRMDASSAFGSETGAQFYPKVSGSYVVIDRPVGFGLDFFRLRASFGEAGNLTGIGAYERFTNYNPLSFNGQPGLIPSTALGNAGIKPERQREIEGGFEASFLRNRVGMELTYYHQAVSDLLLRRVVAPSTGASTRIENAGELENRGLEIMLRGIPVQRRDLTVNTAFLFSRNRNKVTKLNGPAFDIGNGNFGAQWAIEGQPLGIFYWRKYARNPDGTLLLTPQGIPQAERGVQGNLSDPSTAQIRRDANGQPTGELLRFILGNPEPDWTGSFTSDLTYKAWSFRMQWDIAQGHSIMNWNRRNFDRHNYRGGYDYGLELMPNSNIPKGTANAAGTGLIAEEYVEDGSYVKLRELSVAYTLRPQVPGIESVRFRLSGRNLVSFDNYSGYDPEVSIAGRSTGVVGFDFGTVPIPRQVAFGVTFSF